MQFNPVTLEHKQRHLDAILADPARVVRVVDGDTLVIELEGREERVRYIGIDTPESVAPNQPVECFGKEASAENERLVGEGWVYQVAFGLQLVWLLLATAGRFRVPIPGAGLAYYYLVVTWATVEGLARFVRFGPPLLWERIEGTR